MQLPSNHQEHPSNYQNALATFNYLSNHKGEMCSSWLCILIYPAEWVSMPVSQVPILSSECFPQTTDWSGCSASCGFGISSRVTNSNGQCKLVRETRLCQIRECDMTPAVKVRYCREMSGLHFISIVNLRHSTNYN